MQETANTQELFEFKTKANKPAAAIFTPQGVSIILWANKPISKDTAISLSIDRLPAGYSLEPVMHYYRGCKLYTYTNLLYKHFNTDMQFKMMIKYKEIFLLK